MRKSSYDYNFDKSYKKYLNTGLMFVCGVDYKVVARYKKDKKEFEEYCNTQRLVGLQEGSHQI